MVTKGDIWEGHELLSELDRGMLRTFLARQLGDTKDLVWLHLREGTRFTPQEFADELRRLQRTCDQVPQLVRVLYGGMSGSTAWAASAFVESGAIRLKEATRTADLGLTALKMVIEIGECIARANKLYWVHGALSPERVLIASGSRYLISHFGFARLFEIPEEDAVRDPFYVAPEMIAGGTIGNRTDVYGLGTVLYELVCRIDLYTDEEHRTNSPKLWEPRFPVVVPAALRHVMRVALAKDPKARYSSVAHMLTALRAIAKQWEEAGSLPVYEADDAGTVSLPARQERREADGWNPFEAEGDDLPAPTERGSNLEENASSAPPPSPRLLEIESMPSSDAPQGDGAATSPLTLKSSDDPEPAPPLPPLPLPGSSGTTGRRSPARLLGVVLALAFVLGSSAAIFLWRDQSPRGAAPRAARFVQAAASRAIEPQPPRPSDAPQAPPPVAPRPVTARPVAFTRHAMRKPSVDSDICDGLVPCGHQRDF
jgi:serine/threonine-protein kinase